MLAEQRKLQKLTNTNQEKKGQRVDYRVVA